MNNDKPWEKQNISSALLVRDIININFPSLVVDSIYFLGEGWDNTTWLINDKLCFRFPKHEKAANLLLNEIKILSQNLDVNINIPNPEYICLAPRKFQFPFYAHYFIQGVTLDKAQLNNQDRILLSRQLAYFLKKLHQYPADKCIKLGIKYDQIGRLNIKLRYEQIKERFTYLKKQQVILNCDKFLNFYKKNIGIVISDNFVLGHGDLYAKHLILDKHKELVGVIDWGTLRYCTLLLIWPLCTRFYLVLHMEHFGKFMVTFLKRQ